MEKEVIPLNDGKAVIRWGKFMCVCDSAIELASDLNFLNRYKKTKILNKKNQYEELNHLIFNHDVFSIDLNSMFWIRHFSESSFPILLKTVEIILDCKLSVIEDY